MKLIIKILLLFNLSCFAQLVKINKEVKATINIDENADLIEITGIGENLTEGYKSLFYKLNIFTEDNQSNISKNIQSGRFTLQTDEKKIVVKTQINTNKSNKIILLLQIFDENQNIIASDRYTFQDNNIIPNSKQLPKKNNYKSADIEIPGLLYDETRTKFGKDFYDLLYAEFLSQKIKTTKNIIVEEELANRNSRIKIRIDYEIINEFFISRPDQDFLQNSALDTVSKIVSFFKKLEKQNKEIIRY